MRVVIEGDVFRIIEVEDVEGYIYRVMKNDTEATGLCGGSEYETESGAAWAILNEYSTD